MMPVGEPTATPSPMPEPKPSLPLPEPAPDPSMGPVNEPGVGPWIEPMPEPAPEPTMPPPEPTPPEPAPPEPQPQPSVSPEPMTGVCPAGATPASDGRCVCLEGMINPECMGFRSCKEIQDVSSVSSGAYVLTGSNGALYGAFCDMEHRGGGWTLTLKVDGEGSSTRFQYDSELWTNTALLNDTSVNEIREEAKLRAFNEAPFQEIMVAFTRHSSLLGPVEEFKSLVLMPRGVSQSASMQALMNGAFYDDSSEFGDWGNLIDLRTVSDIIALSCFGQTQKGINRSSAGPKVRIGLLVSNCRLGGQNSSNAWIGVGSDVLPNVANTAGARWDFNGGGVVSAFAQVYVR